MRALLAATIVTLACAGAALAHKGDAHVGFVATVSGIQPRLPGLLVSVVNGHERLAVRNLTAKTVVLFGENGERTLQLTPGRSGSVADARIGSAGPPPEQGEFVKDWRVPGEAGGEPFEIVGFLGYRAPAADNGEGLPWATGVVVGLAVLVLAALALPLLTLRKGERESSEPTGSE